MPATLNIGQLIGAMKNPTGGKSWDDSMVAEWTKDPSKGDKGNAQMKDGQLYYPIWKNSLTGQTKTVAQQANEAGSAATGTTSGGFSGVEYNYLAPLLKGYIEQGNPLTETYRQNIQGEVGKNVQAQKTQAKEELAQTGLFRSGIANAKLANIGAQGTEAVANAEVNLAKADQDFRSQALSKLLGLQQLGLSETGQNKDYNIALQQLLAGLNSTQKQYDLANDDSASWGNIIGQLLSGGAEVGAAALSDRRFKKDIVKVGTSKKGINIYEFSYLGSDKRFRGVMASEVPQASIDVNGIKFVDYSKIDVDFESV